jgi:hypothetical protein
LVVIPAQAVPIRQVLVKNGVPVATIVLAKSPTVAAAFAAKELREHVKLITGAELPLVTDENVVKGLKVFVGNSPAARKLGVSSDGFTSQEYSLKFMTGAIVLVGKDKEVSLPADGSIPMPGFYEDKGTLTATYEFLRTYCGVRWYHPTEMGTCFNKTSNLIIRGKDVRRVPDMKYTWIEDTDLWMPRKEDYVPRPEANLWKLRVGIGGQPFRANHSFYGYYDRFLSDHPDWFAQGYSGKPPQLCYTNPQLIAQVVQDARDYFDGKGTHSGAMALGDFFGLVPMDNNQYCKCLDCQAALAKSDKNAQFFGGVASNYIWGFINKVATEVKKSHPNKYIAALSYWDYSDYPTNIRLEPNIAVMLCMQTRDWFAPSIRDNGMRIYNSWITKEKDRPIYLWLYYCFPALSGYGGKYPVFPGYFAHTAVEQMKMFQKDGIKGIFLEHSSEFRQTHLLDLPELYLTVTMARDSRIKGKVALDEFFKRYYGSASGPMKDLYTAIEKTYTNPANYPFKPNEFGGQTEAIAWGSLGTPERMKVFGEILDRAKLAAKTDTDKARVAFFEKGIWDHMVQGVKMHPIIEAMRNQPPPKVTAAKQIIEATTGDPAKVDWSKATISTGWRVISGGETTRKLETRLANDGKYLYIQLEEMLDPSTLRSDDAIWFGDDWELFFAAARSKPYRQLAINPAGKFITYAWEADTSSAWDSGVIVNSNTSLPDRWQVRIALPLEKLLPGGVKTGSIVYANFYRSINGQSEYLGWSPNFVGGFHELSRMGEITLE